MSGRFFLDDDSSGDTATSTQICGVTLRREIEGGADDNKRRALSLSDRREVATAQVNPVRLNTLKSSFYSGFGIKKF